MVWLLHILHVIVPEGLPKPLVKALFIRKSEQVTRHMFLHQHVACFFVCTQSPSHSFLQPWCIYLFILFCCSCYVIFPQQHSRPLAHHYCNHTEHNTLRKTILWGPLIYEIVSSKYFRHENFLMYSIQCT